MLTINVKWQKRLTWVFVLIVILFVADTARLIYPLFRAQEVRVGGPVSYTVMLKETFHHPNGTTTVTKESVWAIRSDGSAVRRIAQKEPKQTSERTVQFASGEEIAINELTSIKSTTIEKGINPALWQRDPSSRCINSFAGKPMTSLQEIIQGEEMINGYRTVKITANNITSWYSLDYGCAPVKDRADWGGNQGFSEHNLVALIPGEPDATLFQVPEQAREASPSERLLSSEKNPEKCGPKCKELLQKFDARYYTHRPVK